MILCEHSSQSENEDYIYVRIKIIQDDLSDMVQKATHENVLQSRKLSKGSKMRLHGE